MGLVDGFGQVDWAFAKEIFGMELKSPKRTLRFVGAFSVIAGIGLMAFGHTWAGGAAFGTGVAFLLRPFPQTR